MRVLLAVNPHARSGEGAHRAVAEALRSRGCAIIPVSMDDPKRAAEEIADGAAQADCVVVGGGDGTFISMIPAILSSKLPAGLVPLGTFNDLARTLELPTDLGEAADVITAGIERKLDVGRVNGDHYFINEASIGISTRIARLQTTEVKRRFGFLAIVATTLSALRSSRPLHAKVTHDGKTINLRTLQLTVANSHHFGGFITNKDAAIDDGFLDLYSLNLRHWHNVFPLIPNIVRGTVAQSKAVSTIRSKHFEVSTPHRSHHVFTDGEPACMTPATFEVLAGALRLFVPKPKPAE